MAVKHTIQALKISTISLILLAWSLSSCNMKKVTKIEFTNKNPYSVEFIVKANNIKFELGPVDARQKKEGELDWTHIEPVDGQWIFFVKNPTTGLSDSFSHGYFVKGELCNFLTAEAEGTQLKVKLME